MLTHYWIYHLQRSSSIDDSTFYMAHSRHSITFLSKWTSSDVEGVSVSFPNSYGVLYCCMVHSFISWNLSSGRYIRGQSQAGVILPPGDICNVKRSFCFCCPNWEGICYSHPVSRGQGCWKHLKVGRKMPHKICCSGVKIILSWLFGETTDTGEALKTE